MKLMKIALLPIVFCLSAVMATASYSYDGYSMNTVSSGSVYGGVFMSYGDKTGYAVTPYTTNYSVPAGNASWGRLYVGVWGGTSTKTGWVNTTLNNVVVGNISLGGEGDTNPTYSEGTNVYSSGNGVWWVSYNVKNNISMGAINKATALTGGVISGQVYGIVLATAYNDTDGAGPITQYWINEGNYNLHGTTLGVPYELNNISALFNGAIDSKYTNAKLNIVYLTGTSGEPDYLYFNSVQDYHRTHQLGDDGNETIGSDDIARGATGGDYFDFLNFDVTNLISPTNNFASYWRGHDDNGDGVITSDFETSGLEGEAYVHPVLSVLTVNTTRQHLTRGFVGNVLGNIPNVFSIPVMNSEPISTAMSSINPYYQKVYRYNSTTKIWEKYDKAYPSPPTSKFTTIDPGIGYQVSPSSGCTLTWDS
jgi:hypothetical protein